MSAKKMMKRFTCLLMLAMIVSLAGYARGGESIVGKWETTQMGMHAVYTFAEDGTGTYATSIGGPIALTWKTEGNLLKMTYTQEAPHKLVGSTTTVTMRTIPEFEYELMGSKLTLTDTVDKLSATFNRVK